MTTDSPAAPVLLVLIALPADAQAVLAESHEVIYAPDAALRQQRIEADGARVQTVLTNGTTGLTAAEIDAMPKLSFACALGVGFENMAIEHARARSIVLANGAGTNDDCVADHAFALILAIVRKIPQHDRACREGIWRDALPMVPTLTGKRLGILGMGAIGRKIAQRALGFEMQVGYHNRSRRSDSPHAWFESLDALAQWCDVLVVATPGGAATKHLVNAGVLASLGPRGYLVNIARGSVVDTVALAAALQAGTIAGAGLDVYESEPLPPAALFGFENVVLTPHIGGRAPEAMNASMQCFLDNARRHATGQPVTTPI